MKKVWIPVIIALLFFTAMGFYTEGKGDSQTWVITVTETETVFVPVFKEKIITVLVEVEVIKEVVKEVPVKLHQFKDKAELYGFLDWYRESLMIVSWDENCFDRALGFIRIAREKGYDFHFQTMSFRNGKITKNHALVSTIIDRDIYFIEPETYKCWLVNKGG